MKMSSARQTDYPPEETPLVSVVIATRNRSEEVARAVESCLHQTHRPLEIIVYDDASTDNTADAIGSKFPQVRLIKGAERKGLVLLRNRGFQEARGDYIVTIDDDAHFSGATTIREVVGVFQGDPSVAAVAIRFVEPQRGKGGPRPANGTELRSFVGCAHALRRRDALSMGGYRPFWIHQGEERDLCIRLLAASLRIVYLDTDPIIHEPSPSRDRDRMSRFGVRNTLLFDWLNVPHPFVVPRLLLDSAQLFAYKFDPRTAPRRLRLLLYGLLECWKYREHRSPVSGKTYRLYRSLPAHGAESLPPTDR